MHDYAHVAKVVRLIPNADLLAAQRNAAMRKKLARTLLDLQMPPRYSQTAGTIPHLLKKASCNSSALRFDAASCTGPVNAASGAASVRVETAGRELASGGLATPRPFTASACTASTIATSSVSISSSAAPGVADREPFQQYGNI
eukprot:6201311-Pleurochrysis_carterae.AAC.3